MNNRYVCVPLTSDENHRNEIKSFMIDREARYANDPYKIIGLEAYLKRCAWEDDQRNDVKIYLIKDQITMDIAAYFGLKAGMVVDNENDVPTIDVIKETLLYSNTKPVSSVIPGIEISHFAVNDNYRRKISRTNNPVKGLGHFFYPAFIYPIIQEASKKIGIRMIYLYAAGDNHLTDYYKNVFQFEMLNWSDYYMPLQPEYDGNCTFMFRFLSEDTE